jgi:hypothetical protein
MAPESVGQMPFGGSVGVQWKRHLKFGPAKFDEFRIVIWAKHISAIEIHCQLTVVYGRRRDESAARQKVRNLSNAYPRWWLDRWDSHINPLRPELNPICYLLALLAHDFLHFSRIRVKSLTLRFLMSYIYGAPIHDVSRSHTTTQHSR